jgi:hypothetical protein
MTRILTAFENDLRSDLLTGRADRWDVSSPRDELKKFSFFVRQIETLIDQAEESEVSSLQESIAGWSKDAQDEFGRITIRFTGMRFSDQPSAIRLLSRWQPSSKLS